VEIAVDSIINLPYKFSTEPAQLFGWTYVLPFLSLNWCKKIAVGSTLGATRLVSCPICFRSGIKKSIL